MTYCFNDQLLLKLSTAIYSFTHTCLYSKDFFEKIICKVMSGNIKSVLKNYKIPAVKEIKLKCTINRIDCTEFSASLGDQKFHLLCCLCN